MHYVSQCRACHFKTFCKIQFLFQSYLASAATRQANPAAELASPAAVGKLFSEQMWTCNLLYEGHPQKKCSRTFQNWILYLQVPSSWWPPSTCPLLPCPSACWTPPSPKPSSSPAFLILHSLHCHSTRYDPWNI